MDIQPIRTEAVYRGALRETESLMDAGPNTPEGVRLDILATLVEAYERKHYPVGRCPRLLRVSLCRQPFGNRP